MSAASSAAGAASSSSSGAPVFELRVSKEDFKFSAAHFVAHGAGQRERLHGHNYRVALSLTARAVGDDGCVVDFAELKTAVRRVCK